MRASPSRNGLCPCCSGRKLKQCCLPILEGEPAPSPEALMRSRYTAYSLGRVGHLMSTVHPESPHHRADRAAWAAELRQWCDTALFLGLQVESSSSEGPIGRVRFFARIQVGDRDASFGEDSRFLLQGGRWTWLDGSPWRPA